MMASAVLPRRRGRRGVGQGVGGGAKPTHGVTQLARRLQRERLDSKTRRMLTQLQRLLCANSPEASRALLQGRVARKELILQRGEMYLLEHPEFLETTSARFMVALWNSWRRDVELLAALPPDKPREPTLSEYLAA